MKQLSYQSFIKWIFIWVIALHINGCTLANPKVTHNCDVSANVHDVEAVQKAADAGCSTDQFNLAQMYRFGRNGLPVNYEKAMEYYQLAAKQNHVYAQNNLGLLYTEGLGVSKNYQTAKSLFESAANQGNADAQNNLASMYAKGEGVEQNYKTAFELFEKSAYRGNGEAAFGLFKCYGKGWGVSADDIASYAWLKIASETKGERQQIFQQLLNDANSVMNTQEISAATKLAEELKKNIHPPSKP